MKFMVLATILHQETVEAALTGGGAGGHGGGGIDKSCDCAYYAYA